jgi:hypothetical protein
VRVRELSLGDAPSDERWRVNTTTFSSVTVWISRGVGSPAPARGRLLHGITDAELFPTSECSQPPCPAYRIRLGTAGVKERAASVGTSAHLGPRQHAHADVPERAVARGASYGDEKVANRDIS